MKNINFLPERICEQRRRRTRQARQLLLSGLCILLLVALGYVRHGRLQQARADLQVIKSSAGNVRQQLSIRESLQQQHASLLLKKRISQDLGSRITAVHVLAELQRVLGPDMVLTDMTLEAVERPVDVEPATVSGDRSRRVQVRGARKPRTVKRMALSITGMAMTDVELANFIGQLSASGLFEDVKMGYAKNIEFRKHKVRQFGVNCYVIR